MTEPERRGTIRIQIVDDHLLVRAGLQMLIESRPGLKVVAESGTAQDALADAERERPDIILLDIDLNGQSGLDLIGDFVRAACPARVIMVTGVRLTKAHARALRLGAMGLVQKDKAAEVLIKAIEKVHEGEVWFDRAVIGSVFADMARGEERDEEADERIAALTARELDIVEMLCRGLKNREIGRRLNIKETTVSHHLTNIFTKLGVSDRLELVMYAFNHELAVPQRRGRSDGLAGGSVPAFA